MHTDDMGTVPFSNRGAGTGYDSAGQRSLIQSLAIFFGLEEF